jgi:hypothetical protein
MKSMLTIKYTLIKPRPHGHGYFSGIFQTSRRQTVYNKMAGEPG